MEVCVDSVQSTLNAERGGEYFILNVYIESHFTCLLPLVVSERIFVERILYSSFIVVPNWNTV